MKIIKSFPKLKKKRELIALDFTGSVLKLAHFGSLAHRGTGLNLVSRDISGMADADVSKLIKEMLTQLKIKSADVINIIPSHIAITKNIEIPSRDPNELKEIVNLQAGRHTPYSREEIIVDYVDIGTYKDSYTKVLLVMVTRNVIKRQFDILRGAGLKTERIYFAPESVGRLISNSLKIESDNAPSAIVHLDQSFTDFIIVFRKRLLYIRSIPIGVEHLIRDREPHRARLIEEIRNSLESYQTEGIDKMPRRIIFTGVVEEFKDLHDSIANDFHYSLEVFNYFKALNVSDDLRKSESFDNKVSFLNIAASLAVFNEMRVNLIPEEIKLKKAFEAKSRDIVKAGIMALLFFALVCCILISNLYFKSVYLADLDKKFQAQYKDVQKLERDFERVKAVKNYISNRGYSLEALAELCTLLSDQMMVTDIKYDEETGFSVKGTARTMSSIFALVDSMEKSRYFKDVKNRYATKRKEEGEDVADFEIICSLEKR